MRSLDEKCMSVRYLDKEIITCRRKQMLHIGVNAAFSFAASESPMAVEPIDFHCTKGARGVSSPHSCGGRSGQVGLVLLSFFLPCGKEAKKALRMLLPVQILLSGLLTNLPRATWSLLWAEDLSLCG